MVSQRIGKPYIGPFSRVIPDRYLKAYAQSPCTCEVLTCVTAVRAEAPQNCQCGAEVADMTWNNSNVSAPDGCITLHFHNFVPWDNPHNLISAATEATVERVKSAIVLPIFFLIGGPANVINMAVFYKQGLRDRTNFCLFALSMADELYMLQCILFNGERMFQFTQTERYGAVFSTLVNHNMVALFSLTWISQFMSAVIATERCLCVLWPIKFQTLLSTRSMAAFIGVMCVSIITLYSVFVATKYRMTCAYQPDTRSITKIWTGSEFYYRNQAVWDFMDSVVFGVIIPGCVTVVVVVATSLTAFRLRQVAAWRAGRSSGALSVREIALTKMLIYTSILFLVCISPISLFRTVLLFLPQLAAGNLYHNTHFTVLWLSEITSYVNSSGNIFIYLTMGSRYRQTCSALLWPCKKSPAKQAASTATTTTSTTTTATITTTTAQSQRSQSHK